MKIGFIGCGNMANAMIGGILRAGIASANEIIGSCPSSASRERTEKLHGIEMTDSNRDVVLKSEIIFLCVKPIYLADVIAEVKDLAGGRLWVSIAAGRSIATLEKAFESEHLKQVKQEEQAEQNERAEQNEQLKQAEQNEQAEQFKQVKLVRLMPNTPALVGEAMTAVCANDAVSAEELGQVVSICESFGKAEIVPERLFDVVTGVSGSSPAYLFMMIEAMADAAVHGGMPRKQAYKFASQAVLGSAQMVLETGKHPGELKDMVTSPAGTTIEAVRVLEEKGFRSAVFECVRACTEKSIEMGRE